MILGARGRSRGGYGAIQRRCEAESSLLSSLSSMVIRVETELAFAMRTDQPQWLVAVAGACNCPLH